MLDFNLFDFLLVFQQGPEQVNDFNSLIFAGFLLVCKDFFDKVEECLKEFQYRLDLGGQKILGHVKIKLYGNCYIDEGLDDLLGVVLRLPGEGLAQVLQQVRECS